MVFSLRLVHTLCSARMFGIPASVHLQCTWPSVCTVQLNKTRHQAGLSRGLVDYSEIFNPITIVTILPRHGHWPGIMPWASKVT